MQSLNWAIQEAAERKETLFCCYLDFENAFNSPDHAALWRWLTLNALLLALHHLGS